MVDINKEEGQWKFDDKVAPVFNKHVRASVPLYDEFHDMIAKMSKYFVESGTTVYDLGTSTGEALIRVQKANEHKENVSYIGYDNSASMLSEARKRNDKLAFAEVDLSTEYFRLENSSFITSVLTMQFLKLKDREQVIERVFKALNRGSAFVIVEKVISTDPIIEQIITTEYEAFKHDSGLSEEHIFKKKQSLKGIMKPLTENQNKEMLKRAGFTKVETFFRWNNFAGFIAVKGYDE